MSGAPRYMFVFVSHTHTHYTARDLVATLLLYGARLAVVRSQLTRTAILMYTMSFKKISVFLCADDLGAARNDLQQVF